MKKIVIFWTLGLLFSMSLNAQTLSIEINNIRNEKGELSIGIFISEQQFDDEVPEKSIKVSKKSMKNGTIKTQIELHPGIYGVSILDDEDENGDMTYKYFVYPTEGVGFSNFELSGLTKPKFSDFRFKLTGNMNLKIKIKYF